MARGKRLSLEEQLEKVNIEIVNTKDSLEKLNIMKKELEEQIRMNRLIELDNLISNSGKSFEEVKVLLCM